MTNVRQTRHFRCAPLLAAVCALLVASALFIAPQQALAKEYIIDSVDIAAKLTSDGGMSVTEQRAFEFDGDFSYVYWTFRYDAGQILTVKSISATYESGKTVNLKNAAAGSSQAGTYTVEDESGVCKITAFLPASDETVTYKLVYDETNVIAHHEDASVLYWQFIGEEWGVATRKVHVAITPPEALSKDQVRAWAHGPLNGVVAIEQNGNVTLSVEDLPANTFVEARALYPSATFAEAPLVDGNITQSVLDEEQQWADEANAQRSSVRRRSILTNTLGILGTITLFAVVLVLFFKYGREHKIVVELDGKYWREDPRPDLSPALVGALWNMGSVGTPEITATILELTDRHVIDMREELIEKKRLIGGPKVEKTYIFEVNEVRLAQEPLIHQDLVKLLVKTGEAPGSFTFSSIESYAKKNAQTFAERLSEWKESVTAQVELDNLIEANSSSMQAVSRVLVIALLALGVAMFVFEAPAAGFLGLALGAVGLALSKFMKRRSKEGQLLYKRYQGIRNFLTDFSRLDEAPPRSLILWNRYLVLATVFGIAEQVARDLKATMPDLVESQDFALNYWWFYGAGLHTSPLESLNSSISAASAAAIAASANSSGAGLGGGFSGGGGFGGGGGGGGAG